ncbi:MAG: 2,3,4,5-tetrahydropyridine-2,6-dicarboxylate N-succinyltransferase, partial [Halioglobus sp.]
MTDQAFAFGLGVGTHNSKGEWLEVFFANPVINPSRALAEAAANTHSNQALDTAALKTLQEALSAAGEAEQAALAGQLASSERPVVAVLLENNSAPEDVPQGYLKLHLISHRLVKPHGTNLDGLFGVLPNVAWTSEGAIAIDELTQRQLHARLRGETLEVSCVDKFPKMT